VTPTPAKGATDAKHPAADKSKHHKS
jgi:hypothetical protein